MTKIKREVSKTAKRLVKEAKEANSNAWKWASVRNTSRKVAVLTLMKEGFSFREIGDMLGITGQRVGALVHYWGIGPVHGLKSTNSANAD